MNDTNQVRAVPQGFGFLERCDFDFFFCCGLYLSFILEFWKVCAGAFELPWQASFCTSVGQWSVPYHLYFK